MNAEITEAKLGGVNCNEVEGIIKVAVTVVLEVIVTVQESAVPEHPPPDQPAKVEPDDGVA